jgi:hypothetical protein
VTTVPGSYSLLHTVPHAIPLPETVPDPIPLFSTVRVYWCVIIVSASGS